jgi:phosphonate transport system substrate-binding protein
MVGPASPSTPAVPPARLGLCALVFALLIGLRWGAAADATAAMAATAAAADGDPRPVLRMGIPPWQKEVTPDAVRLAYKPMLDWLGDRLGCRFVVVGGGSYEEMVSLVAAGQVEVAELSPVPYVLAKRKDADLDLIATEERWNADHSALIDSYQSRLVVLRTRTDLGAIADLRGKELALVDKDSSSGYRYPLAMLHAAGLVEERDFHFTLRGSHPFVTDALVAASADAGATWDFNLEAAVKKHGDVFRVIASSPPIPNLCFVANEKVPAELRARMRALLPTIDPALLTTTPAAGYCLRPDAFYDPVRALIDSEGPPAP